MTTDTPQATAAPHPHGLRRSGDALEVLRAFLKLGLTCFGGPAAHLGYFRTEFVQRRQWLDDASYSDLVALCQFLPGPASSKVGFALGWGRAGWRGALAAWCGFTLPSAVALILFALGVARWTALADSGAVHGLKVAAVAIVAQAVLGMARSLCPDRPRAAIAIGAALAALAVPSSAGQVAAILLGAAAGRWLLRLPPSNARPPPMDFGISRRMGVALLTLFGALLAGLPLLGLAAPGSAWPIVGTVYKAGALVFGGGHVVLPLLQAGVVPQWMSTESFLAGYGAAQAVPGPLFSFAAYLGTVMPAPFGGWAGGLGLLVVIFVPGLLLLCGALPFWQLLRGQAKVQHAMAGINAAVVGLLGATLYDPVFTSAVQTRADFALALATFGLLLLGRLSPALVVALAAAAGWAMAQ
ncbi:chromate efflux transporter [Xenophilus sp.]|uniref:chromate efflux transporter n=1 Tax=Xenophilus sp. TaxID=1873499 RepID=UPI0037DBF1D1